MQEQETLEIIPFFQKLCDSAPAFNLHAVISLAEHQLKEHPDWDFISDMKQIALDELARRSADLVS